MQTHFDDNNLPIQIIGVNQTGFEVGNSSFTEGRDIPWLQDIESIDVWTAWDVEYRDVYILDQDHQLRYIYNLSSNNLGDNDKYIEFRCILEGLITESVKE
jgi:hypothetical protein